MVRTTSPAIMKAEASFFTLSKRKGHPHFQHSSSSLNGRPDNRASRPPNGDSNGGSTEAIFSEKRPDRVGDDPFHGGRHRLSAWSFSSCPRANISRTRPVADRGLACFG